MPEIVVDINGRSHNIACEEGEEERVQYLASLISMSVTQLAEKLGPIGDIKLMLLATITVLDENQDLLDEAALKIKNSNKELEKILDHIKKDNS